MPSGFEMLEKSQKGMHDRSSYGGTSEVEDAGAMISRTGNTLEICGAVPLVCIDTLRLCSRFTRVVYDHQTRAGMSTNNRV